MLQQNVEIRLDDLHAEAVEQDADRDLRDRVGPAEPLNR